MIYAQIKNGSVKNIILLDNPLLETIFLEGFDYLVRIDNLNIIPSKDWNYDGNNFSPIDPGLPMQQAVEIKVQHAIEGFSKLSVRYAAENVLLGITQYGKTKLIADTLADVMRYGQSGSLYQVISALQSITPTNEMAPFLTQDKIDAIIVDIQVLLGSI